MYLIYGEVKLEVQEKISEKDKDFKFSVLEVFGKDKYGE